MLGVFCVVAIYPILTILLLAFHERSDLVTGFSIPDSLDFGSFQTAWEGGGFNRGLLNSFIVGERHGRLRGAVGARRVRVRRDALPRLDALFYLLLLGLIFPYEATVIPLYYVFGTWG